MRRDTIHELAFEIVGGKLLAALVGWTVWMFRDLKADIRLNISSVLDAGIERCERKYGE